MAPGSITRRPGWLELGKQVEECGRDGQREWAEVRSTFLGHWRTLIFTPSEMGRFEGFEERSDHSAAVLSKLKGSKGNQGEQILQQIQLGGAGH